MYGGGFVFSFSLSIKLQGGCENWEVTFQLTNHLNMSQQFQYIHKCSQVDII